MRRFAPLLMVLGACAATPAAEDGTPLPKLLFEGNEAQSSARLRELVERDLATMVESGYPRAAVDDAAFEIEERFRSIGFPDARVEYSWEPDSGPAGTARFQVSQGPRALVESFSFTGNTALRGSELRTLWRGPRSGTLGGGPPYFVQRELDAMRSRIGDLYYERGYLDARVGEPTVTWNEARTGATLSIPIVEGVRYRLSDVRFEGVDEPARLDPIVAPFMRPEVAYIPRLAYEIRGRVVEFYGRLGHPDVEVELESTRDASDGSVSVVFTVDPGPVVQVAAIEIVGNDRTRESHIRSLLAFEVGDTYSIEKERESFENLYGSGLFRSVRLELDRDPATLRVEVEEELGIELFVEPGYGSYEKFRLRAGVRDRNLFGLGKTGRAELVAGLLAQSAEVGYTEPRFLETDIEWDVSTFWTRREEPAFLRRETGVGTTFTKRFDARRRLALGYRFRYSDASDVEITDPAALAIQEDVNVSSITLTPTYDSRKGVFVPLGGSYARTIFEVASSAIGSEIDFLRFRAQLSHFEALREGTILAGSFRTGLIWPVGGTSEIPIQERFFNGGETTVRSFKQDELGALDVNDNPIGGEAFTIVSIELRQDVLERLQLAAFADHGNVTPEVQDYLDLDDFRSALGLGVRYLLPIGPLRLDWGWNPNPRNREEDWVLHLSVGMAF